MCWGTKSCPKLPFSHLCFPAITGLVSLFCSKLFAMILCLEVARQVTVHLNLWPVSPDKSFLSLNMFMSGMLSKWWHVSYHIAFVLLTSVITGTFEIHPISITTGKQGARYCRVWRWSCVIFLLKASKRKISLAGDMQEEEEKEEQEEGGGGEGGGREEKLEQRGDTEGGKIQTWMGWGLWKWEGREGSTEIKVYEEALWKPMVLQPRLKNIIRNYSRTEMAPNNKREYSNWKN